MITRIRLVTSIVQTCLNILLIKDLNHIDCSFLCGLLLAKNASTYHQNITVFVNVFHPDYY